MTKTLPRGKRINGLVLTRECDESIVIQPPDCEPIILTVAAIRGDKVRLAFDADKSIRIDRYEMAMAKGGVK